MKYDNDQTSQILSELGNPTRLAIFRLLVRSPEGRMSVGEIAEKLDIAASTLAFHLAGLVSAGLVTKQKISRTVLCTPQIALLQQTLQEIEKECCRGF